jgi:hypothetical protein
LVAALQEARHRQDCTHVIYQGTGRVRRIITIQRNVNEYALGRPGNPGSFKISYDQKESILSDIKMDGTVVPRLLAAMDDGLVERFFWQHSEISEAEKNTWSAIFKILNDIFETLSQREDFTDQYIDELSFSVKWVELTGSDGISKNIHMMITGHIIYYLRKWRNYYRYENEGWEHINAQMAWFHHTRTQRGGSAGIDSKIASSKEKPIGLWLLKLLFWSTVKAIPEGTMLELNHKRKGKGVSSSEDEFVEAESEEEEIEEYVF